MFHKEGHKIILISFFIVGCLFLLTDLIGNSLVEKILQILLLIFFLLIIQFFRNPKRNTLQNDKQVISPVDGKVVVIEEVTENEYFKDKRLQVSIFMSPINVHVTRYPIGGKILFSKYHPGKYLFAWHPKSSEENERTTVVIENKKFGIYGDKGIDSKVDSNFWNKTRDVMQKHFETGAFKTGIVEGIKSTSEALEKFFPWETNDKNELSNEVSKGEV